MSRTLVGAEMQQIVYREYLPVVLGSQVDFFVFVLISLFMFVLQSLGDLASTDTTYNKITDPSILNEFATVAYR